MRWLTHFAQTVTEESCNAPGSLFGIPSWHQYLDKTVVEGSCAVQITNLNDIWRIALAVLEILTRVAGYVSLAFILFGGFTYIISQGNPERTAQALGTIRLAVIGLVVAVAATGVVVFIAGRF